MFDHKQGGFLASNSASCIENNELTGLREFRSVNGNVQIGPMVNNTQQGQWEIRTLAGVVATGEMVSGVKQGKWELQLHGRFACETYELGEVVNTTAGACK